jgi:DNA-directed RNA polymerase specialized sigma24 family protein
MTLGKRDHFQGKSRFTTWVTAIAVHILYTERRRRRWKDVSLEEILFGVEGTAMHVCDSRPGPDQELQHVALLENR